MVIDSTVLARKALAIVPRWARYALVSSLIVGQLLPVVINVLVVVLDLGGTLIPRLSALQNYQWEALGIALFERMDSEDPTAIVGLPLIWLAGALRTAGFTVP